MRQAVDALSALAQESRLAIYRLLVEAGPQGMAAGKIGEQLELPPATLSFHLNHLETAGLITSARQQRRIIYAADYTGMRALLRFLTEDCCQGRPELCGELVATCDPSADDRRG